MAVCASCAAGDASRQCARCKSVAYCNRDCQKAHWQGHKKDCARTAQQQAGSMPSSSSSGAQNNQEFKSGDQDKKPFTAISKNVFFHDRPEEKTFQLLIDCLRMRQEDEYALEGNLMEGSMYGCDEGDASSEPAFREFIRKAQAVPGLLPPWWKETSTDDCIEYARNSPGFSLQSAQEKSDIQKKWGDDRMPMKLRMVAERVYGNTPGGSRSDAMLAMMVSQEGGTGSAFSSHIDIAGLMRGAR